ncbi:type III secretion system chaperone family protein [Pedobacter boryungensis]|uniref:Uncharacterized protein n=1 Tax=Pedobacter boryungensis TaxID=869962 RepID=A0ABX2DGD5_9SPHI|nr:hypothetical protein [Pedobacter boryungensis]NQX33167.1 hypothetical protein [Pedobacter boryungensis]
MINHSPAFYRRIVSPVAVPGLYELEVSWAKAQELFQNQNYPDAIRACIAYCNPKLCSKYGNAEQTAFDIPHGSAIIQVRIAEGKLSINAPFLALPVENRVALMRKIGEINFSELVMAQIEKKDDELSFVAELPFEACMPIIVYELFRSVCLGADYWDDEFTTHFAAQRLREPLIKAHPESIIKSGWTIFTNLVNSAIENANEYEHNRKNPYAWDTIIICLQKLDYILNLQGKFGNGINDEISRLNNGYVDFNERIKSGKKFLLELQKLSYEQFSLEIFEGEVFVPSKYAARLENLQQNFDRPYELSKKEFTNGEFEACSLTIIQNYTGILYEFNLPAEIEDFLCQSLIASAEKPWKECAEVLFNSLKKFMEADILAKLATTPPSAPNGAEAVENQLASLFADTSSINKVLSSFSSFFK